MTKYTHYQAFEIIAEDDEREIGSPVASQDEAISIAENNGAEHFLIYPCREVTAGNGNKWWYHSSSYSYASA